MIDEPCIRTDSVPLWIFVGTAVLAHLRGVVLLLREVRLWLLRRMPRG